MEGPARTHQEGEQGAGRRGGRGRARGGRDLRLRDERRGVVGLGGEDPAVPLEAGRLRAARRAADRRAEALQHRGRHRFNSVDFTSKYHHLVS